MLKHNTKAYFSLPHKYTIIVCSKRPFGKKPQHTISLSICFANQFTSSHVRRVPTESPPQTKALRSFPKYLQALKTAPYMNKAVHHFTQQVDRLVYIWSESLLEGASGPTIVSSLLPHYYKEFIADFWCQNLPNCICCCLNLLVIPVRLFKMLCRLWSAVANFSFRHSMCCFVVVL